MAPNPPTPRQRGGVGVDDDDDAGMIPASGRKPRGWLVGDGETTPPPPTSLLLSLPTLLLLLLLLLLKLLTPPPKSLSLWAMMPGMAMSSSGERISAPPFSTPAGLPAFPPAFDDDDELPALPPPGFERGFISFVKERRFPAASPPPADEDASEMSLIGESLSAAEEDDDGIAVGVVAAEGDAAVPVVATDGEEAGKESLSTEEETEGVLLCC